MGTPTGRTAPGARPRAPEVPRAAYRVRVVRRPSRSAARPPLPPDDACPGAVHRRRDAVAQRHLRAVVRGLQPARHRARARRQGGLGAQRARGGARRDGGPAGPGGGAPDPLRARALPGAGAAVAAGGVPPRRLHLRLLRQLGHEHRPRRPAQPRRHPHLGQRRRRVPPVQPHQGRPLARGTGLGGAAERLGMTSPATARRLWALGEPVHALTYFADESRAAGEAAGLTGFWAGYFAFRAAPLGPVGPEVVTATF